MNALTDRTSLSSSYSTQDEDFDGDSLRDADKDGDGAMNLKQFAQNPREFGMMLSKLAAQKKANAKAYQELVRQKYEQWKMQNPKSMYGQEP